MSDNETKSGIVSAYTVFVEDENGIYFGVHVLAINSDEAAKRVRSILLSNTTIVGIME